MIRAALVGRAADALTLCSALPDQNFFTACPDYKKHFETLLKSISAGTTTEVACSLQANSFSFHYLVDAGCVFVCAADRSFPSKQAFSHLAAIRAQFQADFTTATVQSCRRPFELIRFESTLLALCRAKPSQPSSEWGDLQNQLESLSKIAVGSIDRLVSRGEKIERLSTLTGHLSSESRKYAKEATMINIRALYQRTGNPKHREPALREVCERTPHSLVLITGINAHFGFKGFPGMSLSRHCRQKFNGLDGPNSLLRCYGTHASKHRTLADAQDEDWREDIARDIEYCQSRGVRVLIQVENKSNGTIGSAKEAQRLAQRLWDLFLGGGGDSEYRPFGSRVTLDGVSLLIQDSPHHYLSLAKALREHMDHSGRSFTLAIVPHVSPLDTFAGMNSPGSALSEASLYDYILLRCVSSPDASFQNIQGLEAAFEKWEAWIQVAREAKARVPKLFLGISANSGVIGGPGDYLSPKEFANSIVGDMLIKRRGYLAKDLSGLLIMDASCDSRNQWNYEGDKLWYSNVLDAMVNKNVSVPHFKKGKKDESEDELGGGQDSNDQISDLGSVLRDIKKENSSSGSFISCISFAVFFINFAFVLW